MELNARNMSKKSVVYIILGPTSTGKTSLALNLAKDFNGEIISADSRQVYKYMDIGTGKLPIHSGVTVEKDEAFWTIDDVTVWGYDLISPDSFYSAYDFALFALNKIREIQSRGKNVFIVGGTGFYIDLITKRVSPSDIEPDFVLREELEKLSLEDLKSKVMSLNIPNIDKVDLNNPVRIIRAIESYLGTRKNPIPLPYLTDVHFKYIGLRAENSYLYDRVDTWVETIWENGLVKEVNSLIKLGFENSPKLQGLVYKTVLEYLHSQDTEAPLLEDTVKQLIKYDLHAYIRRQLTYFKRNDNIEWFDISAGDYTKNIYNLING